MFEWVLKNMNADGLLVFELPTDPAARANLKKELEKCDKKNNGFCLVSVQPPKRPRSTGEGSQNHHLNGHIMQICQYTGSSYDAVKNEIKNIAVEVMGYPYEVLNGHIHPQGEHAASSDECAKLIEASHVLAADLGIILKEA